MRKDLSESRLDKMVTVSEYCKKAKTKHLRELYYEGTVFKKDGFIGANAKARVILEKTLNIEADSEYLQFFYNAVYYELATRFANYLEFIDKASKFSRRLHS